MPVDVTIAATNSSEKQVNNLDLILSDFIFYFIVAAGFSLRFSTFDGCMLISRKSRNLKDAATRPNVPFGTGRHKSLNSG
jgi:hypothetical protein